MKRKEFIKKGLLGTTLAGAALTSCKEEASSNVESPNINFNKKYRWKMVTTWPPNFPVLGEVANYYAEWVEKLSGGRIQIKVFGGGELVPALEIFDTVSSNTVEMGCGAAYYWAGKSQALQFFGAVPFGMNAQQVTAWMVCGGGMELWKEEYAKFNLVPFIGGNTGVQMGGWFNREINSVADLKGLKMRIPGLGGKVLEKAGGAAILVAGGDLYTSLERGVIDATEWVGPYHDYKMGFHKIAKYYYSPGWHEPGTQLEFFTNKYLYDDLPEDLQAILDAASYKAQVWVISEFEKQNSEYLQKIRSEGNVELRSFPSDVIAELKKYTGEVLDEVTSSDPLSKKIYSSYKSFMDQNAIWSEVSERQYYEKMI